MKNEKLEILYVDDDSDFLHEIVKELSLYYNVKSASNCFIAKELFNKYRFDCVISDLAINTGNDSSQNYPISAILDCHSNGLDLATYFRNKSKDVVIIMISGFHDNFIYNHMEIVKGHFLRKENGIVKTIEDINFILDFLSPPLV